MAGKKILIEYDINSSDLKIAGEETLSLTQRVRILKKELQRGDLKPEQFDILRRKIGDYEDKIKSSTTRSRNFFEVLGTLPGPVGAFGNSINGVIETLKVLSSFNLKDIKNSIKDVGDDIGDISNNLGNFANTSKEASENVADASKNVDNLSNNFGEATASAAGTQTALKGTTKTLDELKRTTNENIQAFKEKINASNQVVDATKGVTTIEENMIAATNQSSQTVKNNTKELENNAKAASGLASSLKGIGAALGIGIAIAAITFLITKLVEYLSKLGEVTEQQKAATKAVTDFKTKLFEVENAILAAREGVISKKDALKEYNDKLGTTIGFAKDLDEAEALLAANTDTVIKAIRLRAEAQVFYAKSAEASAKVVSGEYLNLDFWDRALNTFKAFGNPFGAVVKDAELIGERFSKLSTDASTFATEGDKLIKEALELEKTLKGSRSKPEEAKGGKDPLEQLISDLDARIQLEINKENTSREILEDLLDKKAKIIIEKDKLTYKQQELLRQENDKKVETALQEDTDRFMSFLQKKNEIAINADKDEQVREESLLAEKLYFDKFAIAKETEFKKLSKEEQNQIFLDMEEKYQQDLLKIKEKYFLKELDKQKEIDSQRRQNTLTEGQLLLDLNQQMLKKKITLSDYFEVLFTNNNKKIFEEYAVDMREMNQQNFEDTQTSLNNELDALNKAVGEKKLTQEEYEKRVRDINQALIDNKNQYVQKQIELDELEVSSREATVDKFFESAQNVAGFLNSLVDLRQANSDKEKRAFDERLKLYSQDSEEYKAILEEKRQAEEKNIEKIKKMQIAAALADAAIQIARVIIDTQRAIVSFAASVAPLGPAGIPIAAAYATTSKILMGLSIATITAQGIAKIKQIQNQQAESSGGPSGPGLARGMEKGGIIGGRRHAQGGTMIEAEQGEAVMTRGAVTMFRPLLSMMNQMGGGTSFNSPNGLVTLPDNPIVQNPSQEQTPVIIKTYVVENELTTSQQKQARLKELSTL